MKFDAKCAVFEYNAQFTIGSYDTKADAKKAINNFRYKFDMPGNNWGIVNFWIEKIEEIKVKSKEIGEYDYE